MSARLQSLRSAFRENRGREPSVREDGRRVSALINSLRPSEIAHLLEALPSADRRRAWALIERSNRGRVLAELAPQIRRVLLQRARRGEGVASLVANAREMEIDDLADLTAELPEAVVRHVLASLGRSDRERLGRALQYPADSAGGLMNPDVISVRPEVTIEVILRYLRMRRPLPEGLDSVLVVDRQGRFIGAIPLERLATAQVDELARDVLDAQTSTVGPRVSQREVVRLFADRDLTSLAVVGRRGKLLGRITSDDVVDVMRDQAEAAVRRLGHLPARTDSFAGVFITFAQRLPWLGFGLLAAALTALVVLQFEETLRTAGEVAALLPVVASLAGVFAVQTAMVTVRGLARGSIGLQNPMRLLGRELAIGLLLWSVLGTGLWIATAGWSDNIVLSGAAALALGLSLLSAAAIGLLLPIALERFGLDPVFAPSGVTAATDVIAYAAVLLFSTWVLTW
jgi:magnesium transporter